MLIEYPDGLIKLLSTLCCLMKNDICITILRQRTLIVSQKRGKGCPKNSHEMVLQIYYSCLIDQKIVLDIIICN